MKIDSNFIEQWGLKYDEIESDECEYLTLIERVKEETKTHLSINLETFQRIINWKSPRVKGTIKWDDYGAYEETFRKIIGPKCKEKMKLLVALPGIGAPVASTILHFIFPEIFPIYDFRTTEVLNRFGCLKSKTVSTVRYPEFQRVGNVQSCWHGCNFADTAEVGKGLGIHLFESLSYAPVVIGVAKNPLKIAERFVPIHRGRSRKPLFVSAAGCPVQEAARSILSMHGPYRIPTLLKQADHHARATCLP
jgi:hypothetical protein